MSLFCRLSGHRGRWERAWVHDRRWWRSTCRRCGQDVVRGQGGPWRLLAATPPATL